MSLAFDRLADPVLVVGAYGYGNVGDEAVLAGLLAKLGDRSVTVVSRDPESTTRLHGVPSVGLGLLEPAELVEAYEVGAALLYAADPSYPSRRARLEALGFEEARTFGPYRVLLRTGSPSG